MSRLTFLLGLMAAGLLLLIFNHDSGEVMGMKTDDFGQIVYLVPIAVMLASGVLASRKDLGQNLRYLGIWALIGLVALTGYVYRDDASQFTNRLKAELMPGHAVVMTGINGQNEVLIRRLENGHFAVRADVDGHNIPMLVDTGATNIALTYEDAEKIGLEPDKLSFNLQVQTANGIAKAAPVKIAEIAIGPIVRRDVAASVAEKGRLDESLLGMSFLSSLSAIRMEPSELRLLD